MSARTPEDVDRLFGECINSGNLEGVVALYEPDAVLLLAEGDFRGTAALREALGRLIAAKLKLRMNVTKVVQVGEDLAVLYNDWHGSMVNADGEAVEGEGKAIEVVRRQSDGTWRFVVDDPNARG